MEKRKTFLKEKKNWPYFILAFFSVGVIILCSALFLSGRKSTLTNTEEEEPVQKEISIETVNREPSVLSGKRLSYSSEGGGPFLPEFPSVLKRFQEADGAGSTGALWDPSFENRVVVTAGGYLNIRKEPSTQSPVIGKIYRGSAADVVEKGEGFTKIKSGSVEGWVSNEFIAFGKDAEVFALENGAWTATVLADHLNVRENPDNTSTILATVDQGQTFIMEENQGDWIKIYYTSSISGYISAEFAKVEMSLGCAISMEEETELLDLYAKKESMRQVSSEAESSKNEKKTTVWASSKKTSAANKTTSANTTAAATKTISTDSEVSTDDLHLLAAICQAEAGYRYDNCLPVAILVMNRVRSSKYPNNVHDVIYQKSQFPPASSGKLDKILLMGPSKGALDAAADALAGASSIDGEVFDYLSLCAASSAKYDTYSKYKVIGGNCFYQK